MSLFLADALDAAGDSVPLQVHTGIGDADQMLTGADPSLLQPHIDHGMLSRNPVVLLHCYPFVRQAGYLASLYPNVHLDLSLAVTLLPHRGPELVAEALELAPATKLLFATDASRLPEMFLLGTRWWREALARALGPPRRRRLRRRAPRPPLGRAHPRRQRPPHLPVRRHGLSSGRTVVCPPARGGCAGDDGVDTRPRSHSPGADARFLTRSEGTHHGPRHRRRHLPSQHDRPGRGRRPPASAALRRPARAHRRAATFRRTSWSSTSKRSSLPRLELDVTVMESVTAPGAPTCVEPLARRVVCIARLLGTGGPDVGRLVARKLGYSYIDEEIVQQAAESGDVSVDELADVARRKTFIHRVLECLAMSGGAEGYMLGVSAQALPARVTRDPRSLRALIRRSIEETAARGEVVIVSHGASYALAGRDDVLRVLVTASRQTRAGSRRCGRAAERETSRQGGDRRRRRPGGVPEGLLWRRR